MLRFVHSRDAREQWWWRPVELVLGSERRTGGILAVMGECQLDYKKCLKDIEGMRAVLLAVSGWDAAAARLRRDG